MGVGWVVVALGAAAGSGVWEGFQGVVKGGCGRLVKHARYYWLLLAEGHLMRRLFRTTVRRIAGLAGPTG